jgi:dihydrofolate reductase
MKTQYYGATSLDGFIADENDSLDWLHQGSADGPPAESSYPAFIADVGAIAMGSGTYEWILRYFAENPGKSDAVWPYEQPCWIFSSRSLPTIEGAKLHFAKGDVRPVHAEMVEAAAGKNVWLAGGGDLVGQFHDHGLLDELILQVAPVTLGRGAPLLPRRIASPPMRLISAQPWGSMVELRYEVLRG